MTNDPTSLMAPDEGTIRDELAALGEAAAEPRERAVDDDPDVRTVATLVAIATTDVASLPTLSALSKRRVWKMMEGRIAAAAIVPGAVADPHPEAPAANTAPGWRAVIAGLAVAAAVIVPRLSAPEATTRGADDRAQMQAYGEAAHAAVDALGDHGGARARDLASAYADRLRSSEGGAP